LGENIWEKQKRKNVVENGRKKESSARIVRIEKKKINKVD